MAFTILVHISNAEPVKLDVEELPTTVDVAIVGRNPRDRADKDMPWLDEGVTTIMIPWWRVNYIQILPGTEEKDEFPLPFRND